MGNYYYIMCRSCKIRLFMHKRGWIYEHISSIIKLTDKEKAKYADELRASILREINHRIETDHLAVLVDDYMAFLNGFLFLSRHPGHDILLFYDMGKYIEKINKISTKEAKEYRDYPPDFIQDYIQEDYDTI